MESSIEKVEPPKIDNLDEEKGISFQDKSITWDTAADAQNVVDLINNLNTVHFLNLKGNRLGEMAAKAIGDALVGHPEFRKALWSDIFDRRLVKKIPKMLSYLGAGLIGASAKLTVIDLSNNPLGPKSLKGLKELLHSPVCYSLQQFRLVNCNLGPEGAMQLRDLLFTMHLKAQIRQAKLSLKILDVGLNRIENTGAEALSEAINTLQILEEILLDDNLITCKGVEALAKSFINNQQLQVISLNGNKLMSVGASEIADILPYLPQLKKLNLGGCYISTSGAFLLGNALENSNALLEVADFSGNKIYAAGGRSLIGALENKPKLRILNIAGNCFAAKQVVSALAMLDKNSEFMMSWPNSTDMVDHPDPADDFPDYPPDDVDSEDDDESPIEKVPDVYQQRLQQLIMESLECANHSEDSEEKLEAAISKFQKAFEYAETTNQQCWVHRLILELHVKISLDPVATKYDIGAGQFALREAISRPEFANDVFKGTVEWYLENCDSLFYSSDEESIDGSDDDISEEEEGQGPAN